MSAQPKFDVARLPALVRQQIEPAKLTPMYLACKRQLAELVRIDEVKEIADKHAAIAHYAKQIKDNSLRHYADRVYARALARIGELLKELKPSERQAAAAACGIGASDIHASVKIANLRGRALDALVDRDPPARKSELAWAGMRLDPKYQEHRGQRGFKEYVENREPFHVAKDIIGSYVEFISPTNSRAWDHLETRADGMISPAAIVRGLKPDEAKQVRAKLAGLIEWCDELDQLLEKRTTDY